MSQAQLLKFSLLFILGDIQLMFSWSPTSRFSEQADTAAHSRAAPKLWFCRQLDGQLCFRASGKDMADAVSLGILRPCFNGQVDLLPVGDGVAVMQVGLDFDLVFAAMFVRNAKNEREKLSPPELAAVTVNVLSPVLSPSNSSVTLPLGDGSVIV